MPIFLIPELAVNLVNNGIRPSVKALFGLDAIKPVNLVKLQNVEVDSANGFAKAQYNGFSLMFPFAQCYWTLTDKSFEAKWCDEVFEIPPRWKRNGVNLYYWSDEYLIHQHQLELKEPSFIEGFIKGLLKFNA